MEKSTGELYVVYDKLAEKYGPIFESSNRRVALRQFQQLLENMPDVSKGDFQLVQVGYIERNGQCCIIPEVQILVDDTISPVRGL